MAQLNVVMGYHVYFLKCMIFDYRMISETYPGQWVQVRGILGKLDEETYVHREKNAVIFYMLQKLQ